VPGLRLRHIVDNIHPSFAVAREKQRVGSR